MRPTEVSNEEIIAAGNSILAAGRNVTGFALRQLTRGGNVQRLRQVWDDHLATSAKPAEPVAELPVELADELTKVTGDLAQRLSSLAVELNDRAVKTAERRVGEVVRAAGEQRAQAERELADASIAVDELENDLEVARKEIATLKGSLAELQANHQAQAVELAKLGQEITGERQRSERLSEELAGLRQGAFDVARLEGERNAFAEHNQKLLDRLASLGSRK